MSGRRRLKRRKDDAAVVYEFIVLVIALLVFTILYTFTYDFIINQLDFSDYAPQEVIDRFVSIWNLLPFGFFIGVVIWFIARSIWEEGRWRGGY